MTISTEAIIFIALGGVLFVVLIVLVIVLVVCLRRKRGGRQFDIKAEVESIGEVRECMFTVTAIAARGYCLV